MFFPSAVSSWSFTLFTEFLLGNFVFCVIEEKKQILKTTPCHLRNREGWPLQGFLSRPQGWALCIWMEKVILIAFVTLFIPMQPYWCLQSFYWIHKALCVLGSQRTCGSMWCGSVPWDCTCDAPTLLMAEKQPSPLPKRPSGTAMMQHLLGALSEVLMKVVLSHSWLEFHNCSVSHPLPTSRADRITVLIKDCIYFQNFSEQSLDLSVLHAEHGLFVLKLSWCALCALRRSGSEAALSPLFTFSVTAIKQQCFCCSNEVLFHASAPACPGWVVSPQKALCSDPFILCFHTGTLRLLQPFSWRMSAEILQSHSLCITDRSLTW